MIHHKVLLETYYNHPKSGGVLFPMTEVEVLLKAIHGVPKYFKYVSHSVKEEWVANKYKEKQSGYGVELGTLSIIADVVIKEDD